MPRAKRDLEPLRKLGRCMVDSILIDKNFLFIAFSFQSQFAEDFRIMGSGEESSSFRVGILSWQNSMLELFAPRY